jgi:hypothetical protein
MGYASSERDAQEILQQSYLHAWCNLPSFDGRLRFMCWMVGITVHVSRVFLRSRNADEDGAQRLFVAREGVARDVRVA